ncbi:PREDICTED: LOW QUALITY PROTEIN: myeloid leukemia factor 2-like [Priapulus caudatus]|uniref:LOW QUALITY PROTEIN: myeloid leukemia factor 2-like n=1 Tax=Priapulus caudatus TaxID=37621 RepID=A0ABM1E2U1_PRICU|nr:PREDICTED: LOW QUALITY PROTEIN: myeloid leukemia factor 2-like [Priapulus caudatus]
MFGSMLRDFEEDPFLSLSRPHMQQMDNMFRSMADPFAFAPMLTYPDTRPQYPRSTDMVPFGSMFGGFDSMFSNMRNMFNNVERGIAQMGNDPNSHCYTQSTFMSYSSDGAGKPQVYEATKSTRMAPGGVKETRHSVRDTARGEQKLSIGHHLGDRAHIVQRAHDINTGSDEEQEFINIDEEEAEEFDSEWREKTHTHNAHRYGSAISPSRRLAIEPVQSEDRIASTEREHVEQRPEKNVRIVEPPRPKDSYRKHSNHKKGSGKTRKSYDHRRHF